MVLFLYGMHFPAAAEFPDQFEWECAPTTNGQLRAAAWSGEKIVAVGDSGTSFISNNGDSWKFIDTKTKVNFSDIKCFHSVFFAIGDYRTIASTNDGEKWSATRLNAYSLMSIEAGINEMVISATNSIIFRTVNGSTWDTLHIPGLGPFSHILWANDRFLAVTTNGTVYISPDGRTWDSIGTAGANITRMTYSGKEYLGIAPANRIYKSVDGVTWTSYILDNSGFTQDVTWTGTQYAIAAGNKILVSADGLEWSVAKDALQHLLNSFVKTDRFTLAVGGDASFWTSIDGNEWIDQCFIVNPHSIANAIWTGSQYAAVGGGTVAKSVDGKTWERKDIGERIYLNGIAYSGSKYVVVADAGTIYSSNNLKDWIRLNANLSGDLTAVVWTGDKFVAVGWGKSILTSSNGIDWQKQFSTINTSLIPFVKYINGTLYIGGANGEIHRSADGVLWEKCSTLVTNQVIYDIAFSGHMYVAVGSNGFILNSTDGWQWKLADSSTDEPHFGHVLWTGKQFIATASDGDILISSDGAFWNKIKTISNQYPTCMVFNGERVLIFTSTKLLYSVSKSALETPGVYQVQKRNRSVRRYSLKAFLENTCNDEVLYDLHGRLLGPNTKRNITSSVRQGIYVAKKKM